MHLYRFVHQTKFMNFSPNTNLDHRATPRLSSLKSPVTILAPSICKLPNIYQE